MYEKSDKRRIYWLLHEYDAGNIDERSFCDEFYYCYDLTLDLTMLTKTEQIAFSALSRITSRFSEFQTDHAQAPKAYSSVSELRAIVSDTIALLKK